MADSLTDLYAFMAAIRRNESGSYGGNYQARNKRSGAYGAYQFLPKYWDWYRRSAGLPDGDIRDRHVQDKVAEFHFRRLFKKYRNWDLVSVAWHAGEGRIDAYRQGRFHASDQYIKKMRTGMAEAAKSFQPSTTVADRAEREALSYRQRFAPSPVTQTQTVEQMYTDQPTQQQVTQQVYDAQSELLAEILGLLGDDVEEPEVIDDAAVMRRNLSTMLAGISDGIAGGNRFNVGTQVDLPELEVTERPEEGDG